MLEVGAGIGDLTSFFLDRDCTVTSTEPREENVAVFRARYEQDPMWPAERLSIVPSDVAHLDQHGIVPHEVVFCYGVLNQLDDPEAAIGTLAAHTRELLVLEVGVDSGPARDDDNIIFGSMDPAHVIGSITGGGCVPTRRWVFDRLKRRFDHVYVTLLQPQYDRFGVYWARPASGRQQHRVIFVASRTPLDNPLLADFIPAIQFRHLPNAAQPLLRADAQFVRTIFGPMLALEDDDTWQLSWDEFAGVLKYVDEGELVCDMGAGIGMYGVSLSAALGDSGGVLAIETREPYYAALESNLRSHGARNVWCGRAVPRDHETVAVLRIGARGISDDEWSAAASIVSRDRPVVYADELRDLDALTADLRYTKLRGARSSSVLAIPHGSAKLERAGSS